MKSGRGQPHFKTCRTYHTVCPNRACVLECGCPLPLSSMQAFIGLVPLCPALRWRIKIRPGNTNNLKASGVSASISA